jgi:hypothetical protein
MAIENGITVKLVMERPRTPRELAMLEEGTEIACDECGAVHDADIMQNINGLNVCADCYETEYQLCDECGDATRAVDLIDARMPEGRFGQLIDACICEDCIERRYTVCTCCNAYIRTSDNYINLAGSNDLICSTCISDGDFYTCNGSGDWYHIDDLERCEDDGELYSAEHMPRTVIKSYNYKPEFNPRGDYREPKYGVEIEADSTYINVDHREKMGRAALNLLNAHENINPLSADAFTYLKQDGSLSEAGFEIVTQPATYDYHMTVNYKAAFDKLVSYGYKSHDTTTCGLHIHIGLDAFGDEHNERVVNLSRLMWIFEKFPAEIFRLSRRTEYAFNRWAARYGLEEGDTPENIIGKARGAGRYHALNFENKHTVEIRVFRGTLNYDTFIASLQFARLCREIAVSRLDVTSMTWGDVVYIAQKSNYIYLCNYLHKRGLINGGENVKTDAPALGGHISIADYLAARGVPSL